MRLPRHDTLLSLPAEPPREAIAADEALLTEPLASLRLWLPSRPAVVVGLGLQHRLASVVDLDRCAASDVEVLERRAGGGALLLDQHMLCGAVCLAATGDVTESYRCLGDWLVTALRRLGNDARRVEVGEARADVARLRAHTDDVSRLLLSTCYGALSPHEVVVDGRKVAGLAQIRRKDRALFQFGVLLRDQSPLADYLRADAESVRRGVSEALERRTIGLAARSASAVAAAIADAMPFAE
jgi:lipoate-protein ligase A